jgi:nucleoside-diphosphate-sugar epimerase
MMKCFGRFVMYVVLILSAPFFSAVNSMETPQNILVLGGTGRLGAAIATDLVEAGHSVTVFARSSSDRSRLEKLAIDFIVGDLEDQQSIVAAIDRQTFDVVIDASARRDNPKPFYGEVMGNLIAALEDSNVQQFILHGSIGAGDSAQVFSEAQFKRVREVMQAKTEAEDLLTGSGIPYTIIRNGVVKYDGTPATGTAELTSDVGKMGTITRLDLAILTMQCLGNEQCMNKTFHAIDESWVDDPGY